MIMLLRIALILAWAATQLLALLVGGWGLLGAQMGEPGSAVLGVLILLAPAVLAGGGLWYAARHPAQAALALGLPLAVLIGGTALLLLPMGASRG